MSEDPQTPPPFDFNSLLPEPRGPSTGPKINLHDLNPVQVKDHLARLEKVLVRAALDYYDAHNVEASISMSSLVLSHMLGQLDIVARSRGSDWFIQWHNNIQIAYARGAGGSGEQEHI